MGAVQNYVILTGLSEQPDFRKGIFKKHLEDFYHYRMDVYTHFQHTFMFKLFVKWILHLMSPLIFLWKQKYVFFQDFLMNISDKLLYFFLSFFLFLFYNHK